LTNLPSAHRRPAWLAVFPLRASRGA
jgi:hypothetical protein